MAQDSLAKDNRGSKPGPECHFFVHGEAHKSPEYSSWKAMKARCGNPKHVAYQRYGGRGITICPQWLGDHGYQRFLEDMGRRPTLSHTLDRENADGNYEPRNCRWATKREQQNNLRSSVFVSLHGEKMTVAEAARFTGIPESTIRLWSRTAPDISSLVAARKGASHA